MPKLSEVDNGNHELDGEINGEENGNGVEAADGN